MDKIKELVLGILTWVGESAFRLFAVIILAICTMVGWFVYTEKDSFMASYRAQQALPRMNGNYEGASNFIFKNSKTDLIAIFDVNTLLNSRKLVYFVTREGRIKTHDGTEVGLLTTNHANNTDVIALIQGESVCGFYEKPQSWPQMGRILFSPCLGQLLYTRGGWLAQALARMQTHMSQLWGESVSLGAPRAFCMASSWRLTCIMLSRWATMTRFGELLKAWIFPALTK